MKYALCLDLQTKGLRLCRHLILTVFRGSSMCEDSLQKRIRMLKSLNRRSGKVVIRT